MAKIREKNKIISVKIIISRHVYIIVFIVNKKPLSGQFIKNLSYLADQFG
jgi:hypothetical protein